MKILDFFCFCGSFLPSWIRIRIRNLNADPDLDLATQINADPYGSGYGSGYALKNTCRYSGKKAKINKDYYYLNMLR
jgi:hypothetical protein